ncbi:pro-resilin-like [Macrobrachium rosenbergii]|uniref:pro-resilin-like n=1 Tax=Macrobrachium rosenbergii TaxID=79674 RepID=UPI0034D39A4E
MVMDLMATVTGNNGYGSNGNGNGNNDYGSNGNEGITQSITSVDPGPFQRYTPPTMKAFVVCALLSLAAADQRPPSNGYGAPPAPPSNGYGAPPSNAYGPPRNSYGVDPLAALAENIPGGGVPGQDYPILASVPDTRFSCDAQNVPGYYADTDRQARCQVFHICQDRPNGRRQQDSFLCPNGTIFNQQYLVCDWWFNFDCADAEDFYSVNEQIGVVTYDPYGRSRNGNGNNGYGSNGNGNGNNGYGSNGNGNGNNGYGSNGNGNGNNGYGSNGNGNGNNGYGSNGNGNGAGAAPSNGYGAPPPPSNGYGAPPSPSDSYGAPF